MAARDPVPKRIGLVRVVAAGAAVLAALAALWWVTRTAGVGSRRIYLVGMLGPRLVLLDAGQGVLQLTVLSRPDGAQYSRLEYETSSASFVTDADGSANPGGIVRDGFWSGTTPRPWYVPPTFGFHVHQGALARYNERQLAPPGRIWRVQVPIWFLMTITR